MASPESWRFAHSPSALPLIVCLGKRNLLQVRPSLVLVQISAAATEVMVVVDLPTNSALLTDAFSSLRCACGAAKRER